MVDELAKKMANILGEITRVPKNGKNKFQNYDYATESDVLDLIRPVLSKHGIALFYSCLEVSYIENARTLVKVEFELVDGDSGSSRKTVCFGEARDADKQGKPQDKGLYKAMTGACKYWLFKTFLISTGDDPESDSAMSTDVSRSTASDSKVTSKVTNIKQASKNPNGEKILDARMASGMPKEEVAKLLAGKKSYDLNAEELGDILDLIGAYTGSKKATEA